MRCGALLALALCASLSLPADEIRLKDGKKLYGVIVAFDDNMFKVKTDFGFVLVEKDKIAAIIPAGPETSEAKADSKPAAKKESAAAARKGLSAKSASGTEAGAEPMAASGAETAPGATEVSERVPDPAIAKREKTAAILAGGAIRPEVPAVAKAKIVAPALRTASAGALPDNTVAMPTGSPTPPKEADVNREEIRGNLYLNRTNNFRIYKAPSWRLIEDAGQALPNAIVAMGTFDESTLLVVGKEKTKEPLDAAASTVEKRVREVYDNYRQISRRTTTVGGLPGIEVRYRGMADAHDWSGTLVVLTRGGEIFTILGMTYADTDLIQIQENVIARAIASLDFSTIN
jgi:hypothetical protein